MASLHFLTKIRETLRWNKFHWIATQAETRLGHHRVHNIHNLHWHPWHDYPVYCHSTAIGKIKAQRLHHYHHGHHRLLHPGLKSYWLFCTQKYTQNFTLTFWVAIFSVMIWDRSQHTRSLYLGWDGMLLRLLPKIPIISSTLGRIFRCKNTLNHHPDHHPLSRNGHMDGVHGW